MTPYNDMTSNYFDDSLYEDEMHYKISKILDEMPPGDDYEELVIECDNEDDYNAVLDAMFKFNDGRFKVYGVSCNPTELIIEADPRDKYRKFDETKFLIENPTESADAKEND